MVAGQVDTSGGASTFNTKITRRVAGNLQSMRYGPVASSMLSAPADVGVSGCKQVLRDHVPSCIDVHVDCLSSVTSMTAASKNRGRQSRGFVGRSSCIVRAWTARSLIPRITAGYITTRPRPLAMRITTEVGSASLDHSAADFILCC